MRVKPTAESTACSPLVLQCVLMRVLISVLLVSILVDGSVVHVVPSARLIALLNVE